MSTPPSSQQRLELRRAADQQLLDDYTLARHGKHSPQDCWARLWKGLFPRLCVQASFALRFNTSGNTGQILGSTAEDLATETVNTLHLYLMDPSGEPVETLWGLACTMLIRHINNRRRRMPFQKEQNPGSHKDDLELSWVPEPSCEVDTENDRTDAARACLEKFAAEDRLLLLERNQDQRLTWEGLAARFNTTQHKLRHRYELAQDRLKRCLSNTAAELFPELRKKEENR